MTRQALSAEEQFEAYIEAGELRFQCCEECGTRRWPPQSICHECLSPRARWDRAADGATVLSYVVVNAAVIAGDRLPFVIVHAGFDDGVRFTARLDGDVTAGLTGRRVRWMVGRVAGRPIPMLQLGDSPHRDPGGLCEAL